MNVTFGDRAVDTDRSALLDFRALRFIQQATIDSLPGIGRDFTDRILTHGLLRIPPHR